MLLGASKQGNAIFSAMTTPVYCDGPERERARRLHRAAGQRSGAPTVSNNTVISNEYIKNVLKEHSQMRLQEITSKPKVGCIHGMYATTSGVGDMMLIQTKKCYSNDILSLQTTGSLDKHSASKCLLFDNNLYI